MMDEDEYQVSEEREPRIKGGCTAGRIVNGLIMFDYFLVLLASLIVTGTLSVLNNKVYLAKIYIDVAVYVVFLALQALPR